MSSDVKQSRQPMMIKIYFHQMSVVKTRIVFLFVPYFFLSFLLHSSIYFPSSIITQIAKITWSGRHQLDTDPPLSRRIDI